MKHLVTGAGGFAGSHLCEYLRKNGENVLGLDLDEGKLHEVAAADRPDFQICDLLDAGRLGSLIQKYRPDVIYHLAAVSYVPEAEENPARAIEINVTGSFHLLEAVRQTDPAIRLVMISSGEVYGRGREGTEGYRELHPLCPENIYAVTKENMETLIRFFHRHHGLNTLILRPFNHIGPRQSSHFATSTFTRQIVEILLHDKKPVVEVGNLDGERDFTDVRDMVAAYVIAAKEGQSGDVFNICSGTPVSVKEILLGLIEKSEKAIKIEIDPDRVRPQPGGRDSYYGDAAAFQTRTRWQRAYALDQTLMDLLAYWIDKLKT